MGMIKRAMQRCLVKLRWTFRQIWETCRQVVDEVAFALAVFLLVMLH
jgi:hypothetical protein